MFFRRRSPRQKRRGEKGQRWKKGHKRQIFIVVSDNIYQVYILGTMDMNKKWRQGEPDHTTKKGARHLFNKNILRTSAVSSTNFGSILIFASGVVGPCNIPCRSFIVHDDSHEVLILRRRHTRLVYFVDGGNKNDQKRTERLGIPFKYLHTENKR